MEEELKKILEENLALTKEIHVMTKKIRKHIIWQQVIGIIKLVIILVPIIIGIIYLPPLLKEVFASYQELLDVKAGVDLDINQLPLDIRKFLQ